MSVIRDVKEQIEALEKEQLGYGKDDPEYKALQTRIDALKTKLPQTAGQTSKAENEAARIKRETAERNQKIQEYEESVKKQIKQAELDISQSRIDAMEEDLPKEQAQIELAYQRLIFANQQREAEMVEALRDARELEWENKIHKRKQRERRSTAQPLPLLTFHRNSKRKLPSITKWPRRYAIRQIKPRSNKCWPIL